VPVCTMLRSMRVRMQDAYKHADVREGVKAYSYISRMLYSSVSNMLASMRARM
jgi:hypothetical protein